jgi:hypothetical protein
MKLSNRISLFITCVVMLTVAVRAQLPTGMTVVPFYDTSKVGLSFAKDKQSVVGMWEVPGKPEHFLVLGYWGYIWSLYPDTTKKYTAGAIKDYSKKQLADFNTVVMKGWEQGALGGSFDPDFSKNHYFYIIYNKYAKTSAYHAGIKPNGEDGPGAPGLVVVERWKLSNDFATLTRDTTIFSASHGTGYGSSNMVFGKDGLMYITADAYSQNSWDSTIYMRKIMRIDVSTPENGKLYSIPKTNPWYNATNPAVKKEVFAYGFRNTYSITADYITGSIWGAEVGQGTWEEVNIIKSGKNYGWGDGGDGEPSSSGVGIEGPCTVNTATGNAFNGGNKTPFSFSGTQSQGRTYDCSDFTNGTWNFAHSGNDQYGNKTALQGTGISCIILSQAFRGDPTSPFYGYHFVTDVAANYFLAVKEGVATVEKVGGVPKDMVFEGDKQHNGITSFSEDAYGNLYATMLSSSGSGAFAWHDIYRLSHPQMKPLTVPRSQVLVSTFGDKGYQANRQARFHNLLVNAAGTTWVNIPKGFTRAEVYDLGGSLLWTGSDSQMKRVGSEANGTSIKIPAGLKSGTLGVRFVP